MSAIRRLLCGLILCGVGALGSASDKPAPAERRFSLPSGETLTWNAGGEGAANAALAALKTVRIQ
jgi:hypothetical protein